MTYKIRIKEILSQLGWDDMQLAEALWPEANRKTQRVLIRKWQKHGIISIRLDQLKVLRDLLSNTNMNHLIDFEDEL